MEKIRTLRAGQDLPSAIRRVALRLGVARPTFEESYQNNRLSGPGVMQVGKWTYWNYESSFATFTPEDRIEIGAFCAFAAGTSVVAGGVHDTIALSGYPFGILDWKPGDPKPDNGSPGKVVIRNDVWVGTGALILDGVEIGDGAIIGAGAVVVHNVPPYSIVAGCPAKVVRQRFCDKEVELLSALAWWRWPDELIRQASEIIRSDSVEKLAAFAKDERLPMLGAR
jgi:virginiamycin A acetyltransferase